MKSANLLSVTELKSAHRWWGGNLIALGTAGTATGDRTVTVGCESLEFVIDTGKDVTNSLWHASSHLVVVKFKDLQLVQLLESKWDFSSELIIVQPHAAKLEKVTHFSRDGSTQLSACNRKGSKILKRSNLSRDGSSKVISVEPQSDCIKLKYHSVNVRKEPTYKFKNQQTNLHKVVICPLARKDKSPWKLLRRM